MVRPQIIVRSKLHKVTFGRVTVGWSGDVVRGNVNKSAAKRMSLSFIPFLKRKLEQIFWLGHLHQFALDSPTDKDNFSIIWSVSDSLFRKS